MSATFPLLSDTDCARIFRRVTGATRWNQEQRELMAEIEAASRAPLLARIEELERAAEALRVDAKRLNWLESQRMAYGFQDIHDGNQWCVEGAYLSVREAIDAESNADAFAAAAKATGDAA